MHTVEARAYCFRRFTPASLAVSRPEGEYRLMHILDAEIQTATALVVDANAASRGVLVTMLKEFGVANVLQARRAQEARRVLETQRFDIVVCEYHFEGEPVSGQDIMDDLRLAHLLPLSTVVVMISSERSYAKVAEAAEAALDVYLIKPHTQDALRERIVQARQRKKVLRDIIVAVEAEKYVEAAELCELRFKTRGPAWVQAARIGAELWLNMGKPHAAQLMFDAILKVGAVPWARLGVARAQYDAGGHVQARRTLQWERSASFPRVSNCLVDPAQPMLGEGAVSGRRHTSRP